MALFGLLNRTTVDSIEKELYKVLNDHTQFHKLINLQKKYEQLFLEAILRLEVNNLTQIQSIAKTNGFLEIEEVVSRVLFSKNPPPPPVATPTPEEKVTLEIKQKEQELAQLHQKLNQRYRETKQYSESKVQRDFLNLIASEVLFNNFDLEDTIRERLRESIEIGNSVAGILIEYSATNPFSTVFVCPVTAILCAEYTSPNQIVFDEDNDEYKTAFLQANEIKNMSDYQLIQCLC